MKLGHSVVFRPLESRYQLEQPPWVQTVPFIACWMSAFQRSCTSGRTSTAVRAAAAQVLEALDDVARTWASTITTTEVCPSPVFGPSRKNRLGKPATAVPR